LELLIALALNFLDSTPIVYAKPDDTIIQCSYQCTARPTIADFEGNDIVVEGTVQSIVINKPEQDICTGLFCFCVTYIREQRDVDIRGDAENLVPNYFGVPEKGDVILFKYPNGVSHVSFIEEVFNGVWWVSEANFKRGKRTERIIQFDDSAIIGFIRM
jgi:hypothetical protein